MICTEEVNYYYYYYYGCTALCRASVAFLVSRSCIQSVGLLGRGISPLQGRYLHTEQHRHRINAHNTDIHVLSGIRTHDLSVRASEGGSCLRPLGYCDRRRSELLKYTYIFTFSLSVLWFTSKSCTVKTDIFTLSRVTEA
jgi:hypothetical protein